MLHNITLVLKFEQFLHNSKIFSKFCTSYTIRHFKHIQAQFYIFCTFFLKVCTILHIFHIFLIFARIAHFSEKLQILQKKLHIFHNLAYFANWSNEWQKKYFLTTVEFGNKIGQGGAKLGQYLHPIYTTSVWVHSVHVLFYT